MKKLLFVTLLLNLAAFAQDYDLVIKGGHVIDARNGIDRVMDVAVSDGKIAAVAPSITGSAKQTVDASGLYVTPGLIDIHVHVFAGTGERGSYAGDNSVYPDDHCLRSGVTTAVDAGSSGWSNFPNFKDRIIDRSITRVLAFLNIVGRGMRGGEIEQNLDDMQPEPTAWTAKQYPDTIIGVKTAHYTGPEWDPVDRAVKAASMFGGVVMVDYGGCRDCESGSEFHPARPFKDLVTKHLRPGDIYTHAYLGRVPWLDDSGKVNQFFHEARKRGVIFDVGHGGGSFWWNKAIPATRQGFWPDSISTDLHISSMRGGMKDMTNVMSKFVNLGAPMEKVVRWSTDSPAKIIKRTDLGHLSVGAVADVALLSIQTGRFGFLDVRGALVNGDKKIVCEMTVRAGRVVYDLNGLAGTPWEEFYK
ncbi:MAG: amidohydrolase/deacetylase family metallohydrolase [bacterium]|nr:amidohydrolase/deacetylase family metallohydrolase [bacterium]